MTVHIKATYLRDLKPIEALQSGSGLLARITCRQCGIHAEQGYGHHPPPGNLIKHFQAKGWGTGRKPVCPECAMKRPEPITRTWVDEIPNLVKPLEEIEMPEAPKLRTVPASDAAKRAKRLIYMALEDYYDDAKQCYKDGWTDAKVAGECKASETFVKSIREQDFGPLKEPQEIREIRAALDNLTSEAGKLRAKLDSVCKANGLMS